MRLTALSQYIQGVFSAAKSSISVNGMDIAEIEKNSSTSAAHEGTSLSSLVQGQDGFEMDVYGLLRQNSNPSTPASPAAAPP